MGTGKVRVGKDEGAPQDHGARRAGMGAFLFSQHGQKLALPSPRRHVQGRGHPVSQVRLGAHDQPLPLPPSLFTDAQSYPRSRSQAPAHLLWLTETDVGYEAEDGVC